MPTIFDQMLQHQEVGIGKARVGKSRAEEAEENKDGVTLYVSLFFDGTKNNRYNTTLRLEATNTRPRQRQNPRYAPRSRKPASSASTTTTRAPTATSTTTPTWRCCLT